MLLYDLLCLVFIYSPCIWLILPVFDQFNPYMILWTIQPIYDIVDCIWSVQPGFYQGHIYLISSTCVSSIFMYSIDSICLWSILTVYDIFYQYLVDLPGVWYFQSLFNHFILHFGQLSMCMTKTTCIWSILTLFDLFDLYMTNSPGSWLIQDVFDLFCLYLINLVWIWSVHQVFVWLHL